MITIGPVPYVPFKKRIKRATIGTIAFIGVMGGVMWPASNIGHRDPHPPDPTTPGTLSLIIFLLISALVIFGIVVLSQVNVLESIIIDDQRKKIKVLMRKRDRQIDKGEYDIDDNLTVKVKTRKQSKGKPMSELKIKYGKKRIVSQNNTNFAGAANWTKEMYEQIYEEVERIKAIRHALVNKFA